MNRSQDSALRRALVTLTGIILTALASRAAPMDEAAEIDRVALTALNVQGLRKPAVRIHLDLTMPFATKSTWTLVIAQGEKATEDYPDFNDRGPLAICFVKARMPDCAEKLYSPVSSDKRWYATPFSLLDSRIVYAGAHRTQPLVLLKACSANSGNGDCATATALYRYDGVTDDFVRVFGNVTGRNRNEATRFVEAGPLLGNVIVDYPTDEAPFAYWVEVHQPDAAGHYGRVLHYRSATTYGDGNPLAVIDSEMPGILHRLGLWKPGEPLPVPVSRSATCRHPVLRRGEEWCG